MANYTPNYQLHQWAPEDKFLRTDFNDDLNKIDTALGDSATKTAALEAAVKKFGNCQIETFTYTGTGTHGENNPTRIRFSKVPVLFLVQGEMGLLVSSDQGPGTIIASYANSVNSEIIRNIAITWNGSQASFYDSSLDYYQMNVAGKRYRVVAFHLADQD